MTADAVQVREAGAADVAEVERLWYAWADETSYPRRPLHAATVAAIRGGGAPGLRFFIAEDAAGAAVGFASVFVTWDLGDGPGAWLADLYVAEPARRAGAGRALVAAVCGAARAVGAGFLAWHVDHSNHSAQRFYEALGAKAKPGHLFMCLDVPAAPARRQEIPGSHGPAD